MIQTCDSMHNALSKLPRHQRTGIALCKPSRLVLLRTNDLSVLPPEDYPSFE